MAVCIWKRLELPVASAGGAKLSRIRVYETPDIFAEYRGEQGDGSGGQA
jgi:6-pyruvoyltetrahydropterin/6-carboxytetrahydropterin synthase